MRWADNLYVGEKAAKEKEEIMRKADRGIGMIRVYFITLASNEENLFDIFHAAHMKQPAFYGQEWKVVGIASGKEEANELLVQIVSDIYRQTGDLRVREFFTFPAEKKFRRIRK